MKHVGLMLLAIFALVSACSREEKEKQDAVDQVNEMAEPAAKAGLLKIGVPTCDKFLAKYRDCQAQLPTALKDQMTPGIEQTEKAWLREARDPTRHAALAKACAELDKSVAESMRKQGCQWYKPVAGFATPPPDESENTLREAAVPEEEGGE